MLRRYWCFILAVAGLALSSASHADPNAEAEQAKAQRAIAEAAQNIAASYDQEASDRRSSKETEPCTPGDDRRYSDLCAQWKAADAADDAAWWARVSGVLSVVGLVGVAGALYLTIQSNRIARDVAKRQLRAYVGLRRSPIEEVKIGKKLAVELHFLNAGQTPARNVKVVVALGVDHFPLPDLSKNLDGIERKSSAVILPGSDFKLEHISSGLPIDQGTYNGIESGKGAVFCFGVVEYEDIFGDLQTTNFKMIMGGNLGGFPTKLVVAPDGNSMT